MRSSPQLSFDLNDREQFLEQMLDTIHLNMSQDWQIRETIMNNEKKKSYWLCIRTPDPAGQADITFVERLTEVDVLFLQHEHKIRTNF